VKLKYRSRSYTGEMHGAAEFTVDSDRAVTISFRTRFGEAQSEITLTPAEVESLMDSLREHELAAMRERRRIMTRAGGVA